MNPEAKARAQYKAWADEAQARREVEFPRQVAADEAYQAEARAKAKNTQEGKHTMTEAEFQATVPASLLQWLDAAPDDRNIFEGFRLADTCEGRVSGNFETLEAAAAALDSGTVQWSPLSTGRVVSTETE